MVKAVLVADTTKQDSAMITVIAPVVSLRVEPSSLKLEAGKLGQLTAVIDGTTETGVYWFSSDPNIAGVDTTGRVKANNPGRATVTARSKANSAVTASATVEVTASAEAPPPQATTKSATNVNRTGFQMNSVINPNGTATSAYFEWSYYDPQLGNPNVSQATYIGAGTSGLTFWTTLINGFCGHQYYYRVVAVNSKRAITRGQIISVRTTAC